MRIRTYYIAKGERIVRLATKKNPVPNDMVWCKVVRCEEDLVELTEKKLEVKEANRIYRRDIRLWNARKFRIEENTGSASPAFKQYANKILSDHLVNKP